MGLKPFRMDQTPFKTQLFNSFFFFFKFVCFLTQRESERELGRGREKEDTESEAGSKLGAVSTEPDAGLELKNCETMTWAEVGRLTD